MIVSSPKADERLLEISRAFWNDRVGFVTSILHQTPTDQQAEAYKALDTDDFVSIKSGHGCGKSGAEAGAGWHYLCCRPFPKIPCTAPSKHQLYDVLWAEFSKWHRQMNPYYRNMFEWTKERVFMVDYPEEWFAVARTATKENPDALQGIHAKYVFRIIDEASGVPEPIFEVSDGAHGMLETKELMCGNPTRLEGTFFLSHNRLKDQYRAFTWSVLNSSIAPKGYAERMGRKYGLSSNIYRVRVLGQFPLSDGDAYIPFDLVNDALHRDILPQVGQPVVFGVDVARFGDDETVIAIRQGDEFKPYHRLQGKGTMEVAGYLANLANKMRPQQIFVDVIGIGAGVYDRLEELSYPVVGINVSEAPANKPEKYRRLRDELWGNARDWLEMRRGRIWDNEDEDLLGEWTSPKYSFTSDGKLIMETKDEMKKRGRNSPNIADAHNLTFAQPISTYTKAEDEEFYGGSSGGSHQPFDREVGY